jgi:hypothetical protein
VTGGLDVADVRRRTRRFARENDLREDSTASSAVQGNGEHVGAVAQRSGAGTFGDEISTDRSLGPVADVDVRMRLRIAGR